MKERSSRWGESVCGGAIKDKRKKKLGRVKVKNGGRGEEVYVGLVGQRSGG